MAIDPVMAEQRLQAVLDACDRQYVEVQAQLSVSQRQTYIAYVRGVAMARSLLVGAVTPEDVCDSCCPVSGAGTL